MPTDPKLVRDRFLAAAELPALERDAYLADHCSDDVELRAAVERLLAAHDQPASVLDRPVPGGVQQTQLYTPGEQPGTLVAGRYKLLEAIGEGGMGAVWVAEQTQPVRRKVALKLIKAGMDSKSVLARFEAERQALAVMDHPNIAKVLDGGLTETGRPFFVMEYVKGVPITEYCDATRLSVLQRLNLFIQVCQAVQHAHQKGIIHRDLKPSNILVAPYDDKPVPKVIDFGLAKAMHQSLTERTLHTGHEVVLGTPLYMSPEQAQLNNLDVDTRSDLYSLGVLLYELLTGTTPLEKQRFKAAAWDEIRRFIREEEPPSPSTRLGSSQLLPALAAGRQTEPARLTKLVRGELDWIVMKALEKDRNRRYETANGLAQDIERYLKHEPVQAGPHSPTYRLKKFAKRNRGLVLATTAVLLVLLTGFAGTAWGLLQAREQSRVAVTQRERAELEQAEANKQRLVADLARNDADQDRRRALEARNQKVAQLARSDSLVYDLQFREAFQHFRNHDLIRCRLALDECRRDLRGPEYGYLLGQLEQKTRTLRGSFNALALSGNGKRLCVGTRDATLKVWDLESGKEIRTLHGHLTNSIWSPNLALNADGRLLVLGNSDGTVTVWDLESGKEVRTLPGPVGALALSRDGKRLVTGSTDETVTLWDLDSGKEIRTLAGITTNILGHDVVLALSADGKQLVQVRGDGTIKVWDLESGTEIRTLVPHGTILGVHSLALREDGKLLFSGYGDGTITLWDLESGKEIRTLRGHTNAVLALALSTDGKQLFSGEMENGTIKVWDVESGTEIRTLHGHTGWILGLALSKDGRRLVSLGTDDTIQVWDLESGKEARTLPGLAGRVVSQALSADGKRLFLGKGYHINFVDGRRFLFRADETIAVWDLEARKELLTLHGHTGDVVSLALAKDGKRLFWGSARIEHERLFNEEFRGENAIKVWDLEAGKEILKLDGSALTLLPTSDGKRLVSAGRDGAITLWDLETGKAVRTLRGQAVQGPPNPRFPGGLSYEGELFPLALSADGKQLFSGSADNQIKVWDLETGQEIRTLAGHTGSILSLASSGDGKRLYSGSTDMTIKGWDLETGKEIFTLGGNDGDIGSLALSSDGKRLFSGSGFFLGDSSIKVWDLATGKEILSLPGHPGGVASLTLSGDGKRLVSVGRDGTVKIWDLDAGNAGHQF